MRNKTKRLLTIRKLIESELISSQEELLFRLKEMNVEATQSTLSRDLKFMKVAKIPHKEKGHQPESVPDPPRVFFSASRLIRYTGRRLSLRQAGTRSP